MSAAPSPDVDVDVLVIGAGPVGLTAAILFHELGLTAEVVETRDGPLRAPAAHVVNARSFEIWRQAGVDVERLRSAAQSPQDAGRVRWVTKLGGEVLGSLPFERQGDEMLAVTPTPLRNLSQHLLEPMLLDEVASRGATVRYGHTWRSLLETNGVVESVVSGPEGIEHVVRSRYLLACDGAGSPVRRSLGIQPIGPTKLQQFVMVHFRAALRPLLGNDPGVLFFVCDPESGGTFIAHDIDHEWVYMIPWDSDAEPFETFTAPRCAALVRNAMVDGTTDIDIDIVTIANWTMTAQVAERYREGAAFLVGDSAHRFPPTGGLGLNTGVADLHNLAWKIAAVLDGSADAELLDSYECERRPVAEHNAAQSLANAFKLIEVPLSLGMTDDPEASRASYDRVLSSPEDRAGVNDAIANQATHFDLLGLQLGMRYDMGDVVADDGPAPVAADPVRDYVPSASPGGRLPHAWIHRDSARVSTLDLVPVGASVRFVGPAAPDRPTTDGPIAVVPIDPGDAELNAWWAVLGLGATSALEVRPDQHIRSRTI